MNNTKQFIFLCFLCALLLISAVATEPPKDGTAGSPTKESSKEHVDGWGGGGGHGGGWGGGGGHGGGGHGGGGHGGGGWGGGGGGHGGGGHGGGGHGRK